ncbi:MAG: FAD-dependent monooxygenase [Pseudomonadota bacterium]|nr:FAD-dependent monooxygenase [Pseudomonadota bacterium]
MRSADVAIVGGGLAGSTAAAMLGRAGFNVILIDPHASYPSDFRCEKLDGPQVRILHKTGLTEAVLRAATPDRQSWVVRLGHVVEKRPGDQNGIFYDTLVNTIRAEIPNAAMFIHAKAADITPSADRQTITLSTGEDISARLVVLANGLNIGLRQKLGITREVVSASHSIAIGFDVKPIGRPNFEFPALTYYFDRPAERMAYLTLFPIGSRMRANLFGYRDLHDPWLRQLREAPQETLFAAMPGLRKLTGNFEVTDFIKIRPVDLYVTRGHRQPGIVLVGDAFATSCPAAGTGANKVFTDVERLCNVHIPRWLATEGMDAEKIGAFYDDPVKMACDRHSTAKAYHLRSLSIDAGLSWRARRWGRFVARLGIGLARQAHTMSVPMRWPGGERSAVQERVRARSII